MTNRAHGHPGACERGDGRRNVIVGVTGHRPAGLSGADLPALSRRVGESLAEIARASGVARLTVLSPLAEGSDRIVARAALDAGHELRCVLPFPRAAYLRDFGSVASRAEFTALLGLASDTVELDYSNASPELRDEGYIAVGAWVMEHSDMLIAVWDGGKARGNGGTGDVVAGALERGLPVFRIDSRTPHPTSVLAGSASGVTEHPPESLADILRQRPPSS